MATRIEGVNTSATTTTTAATGDYTRLHITPLTPDLLPIIIPPSILANARNISYGAIQTFPEKGYGFVDLPTMDAEKLKKRLNGSILKGTKIRIEQSRPKKEIPLSEPEDPADVRPKEPRKDPSRKRKRGDETVPGIEIGERQVKRGWTTPVTAGKSNKDKEKEKGKDKKKIRSKYTSEQECLFKTVLPTNVAANTERMGVKMETIHGKTKKEAVVHEFSKTTKYATFLRGSSGGSNSKGVAEFVEGKGWVDEDGAVVEQAVIKPRSASELHKLGLKAAPKSAKPSRAETNVHESSEDESGASDELNDSLIVSEEEPGHVATGPNPSNIVSSEAVDDSETSSSGSSLEDSDSDSEDSSVISEAESEDDSSDTSENTTGSNSVSRPQSSSAPPTNLSIKIPSPETKAAPINAKVHPLEALYKKSKPGADIELAPNPSTPSFSFFAAEADGDEEMEEAQDKVPVTPFTQRDFEYRGMRSAAPTPDTAHANKRFIWPTSNDDEDEEDGEDDRIQEASSPIRNQGVAGKSGTAEASESDFQKWFYEHRGDTNRAWKKRRRIAGKEKRHRENKKRQERAI